MRSLASRARYLIGLVMVVSVVAGCSLPPGEDGILEAGLQQLVGTGKTVHLRDLTTFKWDTVYIFYGYENGRDINQMVGGYVMPDGNWVNEFDDLLVFDLDGRPVRRAIVRSLFQPAHSSKWPSDVQLVAPANCGLFLIAPGDPLPGADCASGH